MTAKNDAAMSSLNNAAKILKKRRRLIRLRTKKDEESTISDGGTEKTVKITTKATEVNAICCPFRGKTISPSSIIQQDFL